MNIDDISPFLLPHLHFQQTSISVILEIFSFSFSFNVRTEVIQTWNKKSATLFGLLAFLSFHTLFRATSSAAAGFKIRRLGGHVALYFELEVFQNLVFGSSKI